MVAAFVGVGSTSVARAPTDFGFTPIGGPLRLAAPDGLDPIDPAACAGCHAEVAAEWSGSMHARSFVDPIFQAELADSRDTRACVACHAPLDAERDPRAASVGVACAACHVREGTILTGSRHGRVASRAPHPLREVGDFGSAGFCAGCHDFAFPEQRAGTAIGYEPGSPQQRTVTEWSSSDHARAGRDCVDCHMPTLDRGAGRIGRMHGLRSLEDPAFVASALDVRTSVTERDAMLEVTLELRVDGAGHAVPSGDIFRELHVSVANDCGTDRTILMRHFAEARAARRWVLRDSYDDRVLPGETKRVSLRVPRCGGETRYDVRLLRLAEDAARRRGFDTNDYEIPLASGTVDE